MDKDEQAPSTPPETPEVEKAEPAEAAESDVKITAEPKAEAEEPKAEEPKAEPEAPKAETAPAAPAETPAEPAAEETPTEEKKDVSAEMEKLLNDEAAASPTPEPQPMMGKKHNHVAIIIILSLLVLAAVGFAIFEYFTAQNASCDCPKCEQTECDCKEEEEEEEVLSEDYIYVSEWGIKIKRPEDWRTSISSYTFRNDYPHAVDTLEIRTLSESEVEPTIMISPGDDICGDGSDDALAITCIEVGDNSYVDVIFGDGVSDELRNHFETTENYSEM